MPNKRQQASAFSPVFFHRGLGFSPSGTLPPWAVPQAPSVAVCYSMPLLPSVVHLMSMYLINVRLTGAHLTIGVYLIGVHPPG
jgi:predicted Na+-dependent transporter